MIRNILFFFIILIGTTTVAQKPQRIGYIDMEYILENIPEYTEAQSRLNEKVIAWQQKLDKVNREVEVLKTDLTNEKPLLTKELISEREEDIQIKEEDLRKLQVAYFGPKGNLYLLRKQLVKPIQDQVYNAVQLISVRKKYDFVFDKSSDLIMLYTNKKYNISEQVLNSIVKGRKKVELNEKRAQKKEELSAKQEAAVDRAKQKEIKQAQQRSQKEEKDRLRAERIKAKQEQNEKKRADLKKGKEVREDKSKSEEQKQETKAIDTDKQNKEAAKVAKREALLDKIKKQNEEKTNRKQQLKKEKEEKRKKRIEELEKRKKESNN